MSNTHICGQCKLQFMTEELYLEHTCIETGLTPTDPASMGPNHEAISEAALKRGEARIGEEKHPSEVLGAEDDK